jgi:hypothetical protein
MSTTTTTTVPPSEKVDFIAKCHCGRVQIKFWANPSNLVAWQCDCSDCSMRQNTHLVVPQEDFQIDMPIVKHDDGSETKELMEDATTLYQWGTKTAHRRFCKTCGMCKVPTQMVHTELEISWKEMF